MIIAKVFSSSNDVLIYTIEQHGSNKRDGGSGLNYSCNCPHFAFRKKTCKHILAAKEAMQGIEHPEVTLWVKTKR